jgi:hypothetical protein
MHVRSRMISAYASYTDAFTLWVNMVKARAYMTFCPRLESELCLVYEGFGNARNQCSFVLKGQPIFHVHALYCVMYICSHINGH